MADIVVTPANVQTGANALGGEGIAGAAILAGQTLYKDATAAGVLKLADSNTTLPVATVAGIARHTAAIGQPIKYVYEDANFTPGATLVVGQVYTQSSTPGGICPVADLTTLDIPTVLFVAKSTTQAVLKFVAGGVAKP